MISKDRAKLISRDMNLSDMDSRLLPVLGDGVNFGITAPRVLELKI